MKTDDLVTFLAANVQAVSLRGWYSRLLYFYLSGIFLAFVLMLAGLGIRADFFSALVLPMFWVKLAFGASLGWIAFGSIKRLACPGRGGFSRLGYMFIPMIAIWILAVWAVASTPVDQVKALFLGQTWKVCPLLIWLLSFPIVLCILFAMKDMAPTRPALTGAVCGLLSGAASVCVYSIHCPEMQAPFIGVWYVAGIMLSTGSGTIIGKRVLAW